jgi:hypothetical protein
MLQTGMMPEIVIAEIKSSACNFDTDPDTLVQLRKSNVPDDVVLAMVQARQIEGQTVYISCTSSGVKKPIRATSSYTSDTLVEVACGDAVTSFGGKSLYTKVRTQQGVTGYILSECLSTTKPETFRPNAPSQALVPSRPNEAESTRAQKHETDIARADKKQLVVKSGLSQRQVNNHPWSYTSPGHGETNCTGSGTVNGTAIDNGNITTVNGTVNTQTNCNSTYTPPQTTNGNWVTVDNAAWVTDVATGDSYLIQCTAHWRGSKCAGLLGGFYQAQLDGNNMRITGQKGMKSATAKYHVLQFVPGGPAPTHTPAPSVSGPAWTSQETYTWLTYQSVASEDKTYVQTFCASNPKSFAAVPQAKTKLGLPAEHAVDCESWLSAKAKAQ